MPPRCPNGTRRNKKSGNCESHKKTLKSRPVTKATQQHNVSFIEFCKIASELYGLSYTYFYKHGGNFRHLYYVYNKNNARLVFPRNFKQIEIGTPSEKFQTIPFTGKAIKKKTGITANVILRDITRDELYNVKH